MHEGLECNALKKRGYFITFEGTDGTGKSTQLKAARAVLEQEGYETLMLREPGGTPMSEAIRSLVLDPTYSDTTAETELLLMCAARAQLVRTVIEPALEAGIAVLCDRYLDSTVAYQGYGRGIDLEAIDHVLEIATGGLLPDRTILLDAEPDRVLHRRTQEGDRMEAEGLDFQGLVRQGFRAIAEMEPHRVRVFDASHPVDVIADQIAGVIKEDLRI